MNKMILAVILSLPLAASAQGFVDEPTCYTWNGGNFSAGSFTKCPRWEAPIRKVSAPAPAAPVVAAPVVPMVQQTCAPPPKPIIHKRRPPPPRC